jgi:hypothetical protein
MEAEYKTVFDFVTNIGQGLMDGGKGITAYVKKLCPYYYLLLPMMADHASMKASANFESERMDVDDFNQDHNSNNDSVSEAEVDDANSFERISSCCG